MMRTGEEDSDGARKPIRIVVVGEKGTGKSSLIMAAANDTFHPNILPMLPYYNLPPKFFSDRIPVTIIDTSSRVEDKGKLIKEVKQADSIVLTFSFDRPETLDRLSEYWIPLFRQLEVRVPIIMAGYKLDIIGDFDQISIAQILQTMMEQYREIDTCIMWSAWQLNQVKCFNVPLMPSQCKEIMKTVQVRCPFGVSENGLTWDGFLFLNTYFVEQGKIKTVWTILRKFGYNNDLKIADDFIPYSSFKRDADQSVELTYAAIVYLTEVYEFFDIDCDGNLKPHQMGYIFQTAPDRETPWNEAPYKDAAETYEDGGLSLEAFLSLWQLMTLIDPARSLEYLIYIRYPYNPSTTIRVTNKRDLDRTEQKSKRKVVLCYVFGPKNAGKSALLNRFIGRPYDDDNKNGSSSTEERYAVNMVDKSGPIASTKKTLVMKEIPIQESGVLLSNEALAACDVAIFLYDTSDESSWKRAIDLLAEVVTIAKEAGFEFPCLMVASKTDLDFFPLAVQESTRVTQDIGIETPIPISSKFGYFDDLFRKILTAAENPHLCIPEIEPKKRNRFSLITNRSLMAVSIGTAVFIAGMASFSLYAARKQS